MVAAPSWFIRRISSSRPFAGGNAASSSNSGSENSTAAALSFIARATVGFSRIFARSGASRASDRMPVVSQSLPARRR
jgi:hypothetical protein